MKEGQLDNSIDFNEAEVNAYMAEQGVVSPTQQQAAEVTPLEILPEDWNQDPATTAQEVTPTSVPETTAAEIRDAVAARGVDIELPLGETAPQTVDLEFSPEVPTSTIEVLQSTAEKHATAEKSDMQQAFEYFKAGSKLMVGRAGALLSRWGERGVEFAAGIPQRIERAAEKTANAQDRAVEFAAGLPQRAQRAFEGSSAERAVEYVAGTPQRIDRAVENAANAIERSVEYVAGTPQRIERAVSAASSAVKEKTLEKVNQGKEALISGAEFVAEKMNSVTEKAENGLRSAWEKVKSKKNDIKRGLISRKLNYYVSKGQRISAKAQAKVDDMQMKANSARGALVKMQSAN